MHLTRHFRLSSLCCGAYVFVLFGQRGQRLIKWILLRTNLGMDAYHRFGSPGQVCLLCEITESLNLEETKFLHAWCM